MEHLFLSTADTARSLLDDPRLGERWASPSALPRMTVGALAAHLSRAVTVVPVYLETPADPPFVDAPGYFLALFPAADTDPDSGMATDVRARAEGDAVGGLAGVRAAWDEARRRVEHQLTNVGPTPGISVRGSAMQVRDYLVTRLVELVVHSDDLAASLDLSPPDFDRVATDTVVSCLTEMAVRRHSPLAVIRAMTRVERGDPTVLRVF